VHRYVSPWFRLHFCCYCNPSNQVHLTCCRLSRSVRLLLIVVLPPDLCGISISPSTPPLFFLYFDIFAWMMSVLCISRFVNEIYFWAHVQVSDDGL
jgi:hypothetical protein